MKGLHAMRQIPANTKADTRDDPLQIPSKADFLSVLNTDSDSTGLPLEWMLDHCDKQEGNASWEK
jgi:hypothetical protein